MFVPGLSSSCSFVTEKTTKNVVNLHSQKIRYTVTVETPGSPLVVVTFNNNKEPATASYYKQWKEERYFLSVTSGTRCVRSWTFKFLIFRLLLFFSFVGISSVFPSVAMHDQSVGPTAGVRYIMLRGSLCRYMPRYLVTMTQNYC